MFGIASIEVQKVFFTLQKNRLNKFVFVAILYSTLFSNYVGSWVGSGGIPAGAVLRDGLISAFVFFNILKFRLFSLKKMEFSILMAYFLMAFSVAIAFLKTDSFLQGIMGARVYLLYPAFFFVIVKKRFIQNNEKFFEFHLMACFWVANLIAQVDFFSFGKFSEILGYKPENIYDNLNLITSFGDRLRLSGGFADALNFGYFLTLSIAFSLYLLHKNKGSKFFLVLYLIICSSSILLTLTRGAIFAMFLVYLLFFVFSFSKSSKQVGFMLISFPLFFLLIVLCASSFELVDTLIARFSNSDASSLSSTATRFRMANDSIDYLFEMPSGVGLGTQGTAFLISNKDKRINTDNYYFWIALEIGVWGLFFNLLFYFFIFTPLFSNFFNLKFLKSSLLTIFFVSSLLSSSFISALVLIFFVTIFLVE